MHAVYHMIEIEKKSLYYDVIYAFWGDILMFVYGFFIV